MKILKIVIRVLNFVPMTILSLIGSGMFWVALKMSDLHDWTFK